MRNELERPFAFAFLPLLPDGRAFLEDRRKEEEEKEEKEEWTGTIEDLCTLAEDCAKFLLLHNAEPDAVDLLEELEIVDRLITLVDNNNYYARVCRYMLR